MWKLRLGLWGAAALGVATLVPTRFADLAGDGWEEEVRPRGRVRRAGAEDGRGARVTGSKHKIDGLGLMIYGLLGS